ncbi:hypothetical protein [Staphylococcus phage vB_SsapH-Golestan-100]|nr:hypothetical protein [Staphylococcus phage vB_SsapH-Golestan-100]
MTFDKVLTISTLSVILLSISLLLLVVYLGINKKKNILQNTVLYGILILGTYILAVAFSRTSSLIKTDILNNTESANRFNSFTEPYVVVELVLTGVVIGVIAWIITKYVKRHRFKWIGSDKLGIFSGWEMERSKRLY